LLQQQMAQSKTAGQQLQAEAAGTSPWHRRQSEQQRQQQQMMWVLRQACQHLDKLQ
jgi:hypothetical protein